MNGPVLRAAEQAFDALLRACHAGAWPDHIPTIVDITAHREEASHTVVFVALLDTQAEWRWRVSIADMESARDPLGRAPIPEMLRFLLRAYDRLRRERLREMEPDRLRRGFEYGVDHAAGRDLTATEIRAREIAQYAPPRFAEHAVALEAFGRWRREAFEAYARLHQVDERAEARARDLLLSCLTSTQAEEYRKDRSFKVTGSSGRRFRIRSARAYNIDMLDHHGGTTGRYCFLPAGNLAMGDIMLAQKIALENDEPGALAIVNHRPEYGFGAVSPARRGFFTGSWLD